MSSRTRAPRSGEPQARTEHSSRRCRASSRQSCVCREEWHHRAISLISEPQVDPDAHHKGVGLYFGEVASVEAVRAALENVRLGPRAQDGGPVTAPPWKVRVVLTNGSGRVLLGRTRDGACHWGLPGGSVDVEDADALAAAKRELAGETGARSCSRWRPALVDEVRRTSVFSATIASDGDDLNGLDPSQDPDHEFSELRFFEAGDVAAMGGGDIWDDAQEYVALVMRHAS